MLVRCPIREVLDAALGTGNTLESFSKIVSLEIEPRLKSSVWAEEQVGNKELEKNIGKSVKELGYQAWWLMGTEEGKLKGQSSTGQQQDYL